MEGKAAALVLENDAVVPRCEPSEQRAKSVERGVPAASRYFFSAIASFEPVVSGDPAREWGEHASKFVGWSATHYRDGAAEPVSQLIQKGRQFSRHPHQIWRWSDLDKRSVEIKKQRVIAMQRWWCVAAPSRIVHSAAMGALAPKTLPLCCRASRNASRQAWTLCSSSCAIIAP